MLRGAHKRRLRWILRADDIRPYGLVFDLLFCVLGEGGCFRRKGGKSFDEGIVIQS